jgi:gamma-polyglutamate biosynthesis protein CapA
VRPSETRADFFELVAVGDISLGDVAQGVGDGVHSRFERSEQLESCYPFTHTPPLFEGAAVVFGNLETVISHSGLRRSSVVSMEMRGHPAAAQRLARAGFSVLNVANNHTMQHGMDPFVETIRLLEGEGIAVVGVASAERRGCVPRTLMVGDTRVCFLGFAFEPDKYFDGPVGYAFGPECDVMNEVALARQSHDIVICSLHWGVEFVRHPAPAEEVLGRQLIDAGASIVLGHHPHVARRIDRYNGGLIVYSLGNFVFDQLWNPWLRTGLVVRVRLSKNGVEGYDTDWVWIEEDYQPKPMVDDRRRSAAAAFDELSVPPEWASREADYRTEYERLVSLNRIESYRHFVRNLSKRPLRYSMQTLMHTARKKAAALAKSRTELSPGRV